ncbi:hypothetical protein HFP57_16860 [Parasphingopyxis algicola]|uniref:hypothetical protein n=1 Tax=Parasphingopyxis algicola TaxID=2026624 RepID=UPI0015A1FC89|nr:hypothetical protein [Parasphingopyxis algicola]QLC26539.1 hypothetical protein HFP57_16860 [Parasphingopyxis algicola]
MEPRDDLGDWLADGERQEQGRRRTAAARERLEALPAIRTFLSAVAGCCDGDAVRIGSAIEALFADTHWVNTLVRDWIGEARRDWFFTPPVRQATGPFHRSALLLERPQATVALCAIDPDALRARKRDAGGTGSVFFPGNRAYLKFIETGGLTMSFWAAPELDERTIDPADGRCRRTDCRRVDPGELVAVDMARQSYVFERADRPVLFLHGDVRVGGAALAGEFDAVSGALKGLSSGSQTWSRTQMMLSFLRLAGCREPGPSFDRIVADAPFFVRWHAMREWLALDSAAAWPRLSEMARHDPHPEVQAAARQVVTQLGARMSGLAACR